MTLGRLTIPIPRALRAALPSLLMLPALASAQAAVLYKDRAFTLRDKPVKGANNYGDLQGPALENRHFAYFVSVMEAHVHADMIGKRKSGLHLWHFAGPYDRHGGWDWGEDILKVNTTLAAGTPALLVNGAIRTFDLAQMDSCIVHVLDSSAAQPSLRVSAHGWRAGLARPVDFHWTLRTRLEDRFMHGEVRVTPAAGVTVLLGVIKAAQAAVRRDSARAQLAMTGLPTYWSDSALLAVRSSPAWFRGFFDQEGSVGLRLVPDAEGTVRWTQGGSWSQEPQPVWRQTGWETSWLPEPAGTTGLLAGDRGRAPRASAAAAAPAGVPGWRYKLRQADGRRVIERRPAGG